MPTVLHIVIALVVVLISGQAPATTYQCPASISANWSISAVPNGWQTSDVSRNSGRHPLSAVTFTHGHPSEGAFLRPSDRKESAGGKAVETYELSQRDEHAGWLVCMYLNTPAVVFKPLAARHQRCEVSYLNKAVSTISCR